jgi:uncharacterized C2H2 Zn-finger protein
MFKIFRKSQIALDLKSDDTVEQYVEKCRKICKKTFTTIENDVCQELEIKSEVDISDRNDQKPCLSPVPRTFSGADENRILSLKSENSEISELLKIEVCSLYSSKDITTPLFYFKHSDKVHIYRFQGIKSDFSIKLHCENWWICKTVATIEPNDLVFFRELVCRKTTRNKLFPDIPFDFGRTKNKQILDIKNYLINTFVKQGEHTCEGVKYPEKESFKCDECDKIFSRQISLVRHIENKH